MGIVGLGAAAEIVSKEQALTTAHMAAMRDNLQARLLRAFPQVKPTHESYTLTAHGVLHKDHTLKICIIILTTFPIVQNKENRLHEVCVTEEH